MKSLITTLLLVITLSSTVFGDTLEDARVEYTKGNYQNEANILKKLSHQGDFVAQYNLADMYFTGRGLSKDNEKAFKWLSKSAGYGFAPSQAKLGAMYFNGYGVAKDYKEAVKWFRLAAKQKNIEAQYNMGMMHSHGYGLSQDSKKAVKWYLLAAEQGYSPAQFFLAPYVCYGKWHQEKL